MKNISGNSADLGPSHRISREFAVFHYPIGSMYGIYANIGGILMVNVTILYHIYIAYMDPMGITKLNRQGFRSSKNDDSTSKNDEIPSSIPPFFAADFFVSAWGMWGDHLILGALHR